MVTSVSIQTFLYGSVTYLNLISCSRKNDPYWVTLCHWNTNFHFHVQWVTDLFGDIPVFLVALSALCLFIEANTGKCSLPYQYKRFSLWICYIFKPYFMFKEKVSILSDCTPLEHKLPLSCAMGDRFVCRYSCVSSCFIKHYVCLLKLILGSVHLYVNTYIFL